MTDKKELVSSAGEFLVFVGDDGAPQVHVRIAEGTVWLTQKQLAVLYGKDVRTINEHLTNIYDEEELAPEATIRKFRIVQTERNRTVSRKIAAPIDLDRRCHDAARRLEPRRTRRESLGTFVEESRGKCSSRR
jgi:hypothetical protein